MKLQEVNKQKDGTINNLKADLNKLEKFVLEEKEIEASKLALQKKHEEILLQINVR